MREATLNRLVKELDVEERLDAMIDRLIKRLLFVRGLKSTTSASATVPPSYRSKGLTPDALTARTRFSPRLLCWRRQIETNV